MSPNKRKGDGDVTLIVQPRKSRRKYIHDYHAKILVGENEDRFGNGGGIDVDERIAKTKAIAEAVERYCASHPRVAFLEAAYSEMRSKAFNPDKLIFFDEAQYTDDFLYRRFHPNQKMCWVQGESLLDGRKIWVPAFSVYLGYNEALIGKEEARYMPNISCGLAVHTTKEQAIAAGLLELIERDAAMHAWMYKRNLPRLNLELLESSELKALKDNLHSEGLTLSVLLSTVDFPVYSTISIIDDPRSQSPSTTFGMSTAYKLEEAVVKSTMEAIMMRNTLDILLETGENKKILQKDVRTFLDHAIYYANPSRKKDWFFLTKGALLSPEDIKQTSVDLEGIKDFIHKTGREAVVVDLTRKEALDIGLVCVRVLVSDLQPMNFDHQIRFLRTRRVSPVLNFKTSSRLNSDPHPFT